MKLPSPNELVIRQALCKHPLVAVPKKNGARIVEELGLHKGAVRADLAVIDHNLLTGFEIKSHGDNLKRLPAQIELYSAIFDFCYLVAAPKHIEKALKMLPESWGLIVAEPYSDGTVELVLKRDALTNCDTDIVTRCQLLWKDEVALILKTHNSLDGLATAKADILRYRMARTMTPLFIRHLVCKTLRERSGWRRAFRADGKQ